MKRISSFGQIIGYGLFVCGGPSASSFAQTAVPLPYVQHLVFEERILLQEEIGPACTLAIDLEFLSEEAPVPHRLPAKRIKPEAFQLGMTENAPQNGEISKPVKVPRQMLETGEETDGGLLPHDFSALNRAVIQAAFGQNGDISFLMAAARYRDSIAVGYRKEAGALRKEFPEAVSLDYAYRLNGKVVDTGRIYQTYRLESMSYTGGAHPITLVRYLNFFDGKAITLTDAFGEKAEGKLRKVLLECLLDQEGVKKTAQLAELSYFPDRFFVSENFYCTHDACVFVYNPYEIAAYSKGLVEISVPLAKLRKNGLK
ncbi:MAG: RsiV family protein [Bacteroidales bacterium]|nr:RsiV family protein [Bacteroidales bacterium]